MTKSKPTRESINGRIDKISEWLSNPTAKKQFFELLDWVLEAERKRCAEKLEACAKLAGTRLSAEHFGRCAFIIRGLK